MDDYRKTCADLVGEAWARRRETFAGFMAHGLYSDADDLTDEARAFFEAEGEFNDYGLAFEYVAPGTYNDQPEGFFRYLISTGGPGDELRFFASPKPGRAGQGCPQGWSLYRAEFWRLDWFDGAPLDVTGDEVAQFVWQAMDDVEAPIFAFDAAEA